MDDSARDDLDHLAASITAAVLRFDVERLPPNPIALPYDEPGKLGQTAFLFLPDQRLVANDALASHLAALPKPVLLAALARKGYIAVWHRDGLPERATGAWDHSVANSQHAFEGKLRKLSLTDSDSILVETTQERLYVPVPAVRQWITDYRVDILWEIRDLHADPGARARLALRRGDGSGTPE